MGYKVQFESGKSVEFDNEPTQADIDEADAFLHGSPSQQPKKEEPGFLGQAADLYKGVMSAPGNLAAKSVAGMAGLVAPALPDSIGDKVREIYNAQADRQEKRGFMGMGAPQTELGKGAQGVAEGLGAVAMVGAAPLVGLPALAGQAQYGGQQTMDQLHERGVTPDAALTAARVQAGANTALGLIPGLGAAKGALVNWLSGQAGDRVTYSMLKDAGFEAQAKELLGQRALDTEGWFDSRSLIDAIVGGVGGRMSPKPIKPQKPGPQDPTSRAIDDELIQAELDAPEGAVPQGETPEQIAQYKALAEAQAASLRGSEVGAGRRGGPLQGEGTIEMGMRHDPNVEIDAQTPTAPQYGRGLQTDQAQSPGFRNGLPEVQETRTLPPTLDQPFAGPEVSGALPVIDAPRIPGTELPAPRPQGETPLPTITPEPLPQGDATGRKLPQVDFSESTPVLPEAQGETPLPRIQDALPQPKAVGETPLPKIGEDQFPVGRQEGEGTFGPSATLGQTRMGGRQRGGAKNNWNPYEVKQRFLSYFGMDDMSKATKRMEARGKPDRTPMTTRQGRMSEFEANQQFRVAQKFKQGGAVDPQVFAEGFRMMARGLSKLTDRPWLRNTFPADEFQTNGDGTPMVLLHGTTKSFDKFQTGEQGVHSGFVVPAHLIRLNEGETAKPRTVGRQALERNKFKEGFNVRPSALKKGNYPFLSEDMGLWSPANLMKNTVTVNDGVGYRLFDLLNEEAAKAGKPEISQERYDRYSAAITKLGDDDARANKLFNKLLKEAGVDGFFYKNTGESLAQRPDFQGVAEHPTSFVTYDADNLVSIYSRKGVPTSQRGGPKEGWDPGKIREDITGGITRLTNAVMRTVGRDPAQSTHPISMEARQQAAASKMAGFNALKAVISKDIPFAKIKDFILNHTPLDNAMNFAIGGKEMMASIKDHPAIYWIGSKFTNARKRADLYHREFLRPLEQNILKMSQTTGGAKLAQVFSKEMFARKRLSPEALQRIGLSETEIQVYGDLRREFDVALNKLNEYRKSIGKDPVDGHEAYLSSRWAGDWKTPVYDRHGKLVWYIAETSKGKAEHALAYLAKHYDIDPTKSQIEHKRQFFATEDSFNLAKYAEIKAMLGKDDPIILQMEAAYKDKTGQEASTLLGHSKHMEPKSDTRGFLGDRPWVNDAQNTRDMMKSQLDYLRNTHTFVEMQTALKEVNDILGDQEINQHDPKLVKLLQDVKQAEMGHSTIRWLANAELAGSKWLSEGLNLGSKLFPPLAHVPTDMGSINKGLGWAKTYFYLTKLGMFNIPFAAMSVVQPVFTIPHHIQLTGEGYSHNMAKTWTDALHGGLSAYLGHWKSPKDRATLTDTQKAAIEYMEANGVGDLNQYSEANDIGLPAMAQKLKHFGGMSMTQTERFARNMAFMGYVSHLEQSGKFKGDQHAMFQKAEELTNKSMANYRHTERAGMFQKTGTLGSMAGTLQTFKINQFNQLYDFTRHAQRTGNWAPLFAMMGTQFVMAGALGMFALDEADDLYNLFKKGAVEMGWLKDKAAIEWSPKHHVSKNFEDWAAHGLFSKVAGDADFGSRMSAANPVDATFSGVLPFAADYGKQIAALGSLVKDAVSGSDVKESGQKALHAVLPASVKQQAATQMSTFTDPQGNPYPTTKDPDHITYRRSEEEKQRMATIGMRSTAESKYKEDTYRSDQTKSLIERTKTVQKEKFEKAARNQNWAKAGEALSEYVSLGGDEKSLIKGLYQSEAKRLFTPDEWQAINAKGVDGMMEIMRRREFRGVR